MRGAVVAIFLLLVAVGVWLWRSNTSTVVLPDEIAEKVEDQPGATAPAASERLEATPAAPPGEAPAEAPAPLPIEPQPGFPLPSKNFSIAVVDRVTRQPVRGFRVSVALPGGRTQLTSLSGTPVSVTEHARGDLLVEARGYEPWHQSDFVPPTIGEDPVTVTIELDQALVAAGITLHVHDTALQPIGNARFEAFLLQPGDHERDWWNGKPMWSRRTAAADGKYTLPTLAPGDYGIRALAVDAQGLVLPFLPYTHVFTLTGSNGFVEDVPLEAGCIPEFEVVDAYGKLLVPGTPSIGLSLRLPGGPEVSRQWLVKQQEELFRGLDLLPGVGPASPEVPVAAGTWQFEVRRDGLSPHVETVLLRSGERQRIRVAVP